MSRPPSVSGPEQAVLLSVALVVREDAEMSEGGGGGGGGGGDGGGGG